MTDKKPTPWRKVYEKFGFETQTEFARLLGAQKSKISRALRDPRGLINGNDQEKLLILAAARGVHIDPSDILPDV